MQYAAKIKRAAVADSEEIFLFLACVLWPFYFFASGTPQPFVLFLAGYCWAVWQRKAGARAVLLDAKSISIPMVVFLAYSWLVNGFYALQYDSLKPIVYSLYFTLSFAVAICFGASIESRRKIADALYIGIAVSLIVQAEIALINLSADCSRETLFFNNPNQLALYSLLCLCILVYLNTVGNRHFLLFFTAVLSSLFLIFVTLSMGAFVSVALLLIIQIVFGVPRVRRGLALASVLLAVALLGSMYALDFNKFDCERFDSSNIERKYRKALISKSRAGSADVYGAVSREESANPGVVVNFLTYRGYHRIWEHPEYLLFGAGEGVDRDFTRHRGEQKELHSAFGTLVFSYGVIGTCFLAYILFLLVTRGGPSVFIFLLPLIAYSMFHNTLRQPFLWLFVVLLIYLPPGFERRETYHDPEVTPDGSNSG